MIIPPAYKLTAYEIILTLGCNLSCSYCYEKHESKTPIKNTTPMSTEIIDQAIAFIRDSHDKMTDTIYLSFFGGEPLLYFSHLQTFIEKFETMLASLPNKKRPQYTASTNLVLPTSSQLDYLLDKQFSLLVSLDGDKISHSLSRGQDSFYPILNNISYLQSRGMSIIISMTITRENIKYFRDNIVFLNVLGQRFRWKINTSEDFQLEELLALLDDLRWLSQNGYLNLDDSLAKISNYTGRKTPCIDPHQTISIGPDGNLYICSRVNWKLGDVYTGITKYDQVKDLPFFSGTHHPSCKSCVALKYCLGGCLGEHLEETGTYTTAFKLSKNSCIIHKLLGILLEENQLAKQITQTKE